MPKIPIVSAKDTIKALEKIGFTIVSQRGSHIKLTKLSQTVVIPNHHTLKKGTLKKGILNPIGLSVAEFIKLLHH